MKQYATKEECLAVNGEHAWYDLNKGTSIGCLVYHTDGYCSHNDPVMKCHHCPATKTYTRIQAPKFEWIES
jgi:hypothetical protein